MKHRKSQLEESLEYHQFVFDADSEVQWIKEHLPAAASTEYGKNLIDVTKQHKKHQVRISHKYQGLPQNGSDYPQMG